MSFNAQYKSEINSNISIVLLCTTDTIAAEMAEKLQKIAHEELGEVPARIPEDLLALRQWIKCQPHLRVRDNDQFLLQFLRGCKYSRERAKEKLDLFFSLKSKYPEMLNTTDVDDVTFREIHNLGCFQILPKPLSGIGPRILVLRFNFQTNKNHIEDVFQLGCAMHELLMARDLFACICGMIYIIDFDLTTASHMLQMTPNFCKKIVSFFERSMPFRIKSVYFVNTSAAARQFFKILFPFFSEKLRRRVHVLGQDLVELQKDIPVEYLPQDYGGELASVEELAWEFNETWDANRNFFRENAHIGTDASLRPGKPLDIDGFFGVGGSFRKLIVD